MVLSNFLSKVHVIGSACAREGGREGVSVGDIGARGQQMEEVRKTRTKRGTKSVLQENKSSLRRGIQDKCTRRLIGLRTHTGREQ